MDFFFSHGKEFRHGSHMNYKKKSVWFQKEYIRVGKGSEKDA